MTLTQSKPEGPLVLRNVELLYTFERRAMLPPTEAPSVRNLAHEIFDKMPYVSRVRYVVTRGRIPMFLFQSLEHWYDVTGQPVRIEAD